MNLLLNKLKLGNLLFILISGIGGLLLSFAGFAIGWMVGTLVLAGTLSLWRPRGVSRLQNEKGLARGWLRAGQWLLGVQLGQQINLSVVDIFEQSWLTIVLMLVLSIVVSLLSGFMLFGLSQNDLITSLYGTTPGGLSSMAGIAADVGANTAIVSIIQSMRVFLVVGTIPLIASSWHGTAGINNRAITGAAALNSGTMLWTAVIVGVSLIGSRLSKRCHLPAPWLLGSMIGVAGAQTIGGTLAGHNLVIWWPHALMIIAQLLIGSSVGAGLRRTMFDGLVRTLFVGFLSSIGLIVSMFLCALLVAKITGLDLMTAVLAFSPGGIAEMATTSVVLGAESTFVVGVQVLRVMAICLILPPLFAILNRKLSGSETDSCHVG